MSSGNNSYAPRPLSSSREYPGYQFYAILRMEGCTSEECLRYAALTVQNWLCERIEKAGGDVPEEARCPIPAEYRTIPSTTLRSCRLSFAEIISIPSEGVWALVVREPAPTIIARSFVTQVGLRVMEDNAVEFGVYTDVVDRDPNLREQDRAFRPQFVRLLFETEGMTLSQVEPLPFRQYIEIGNKRDVGHLKDLADDRNNQLPLIVFTHTQKIEKIDLGENDAMMELMKAAMPAPFMQLPSTATSIRITLPVNKQPSYQLPYDVSEFAKHSYGFGRVYAVLPNAFSELRAKYSRVKLNEGDILILEPKAFGGAVRTIPYREGLKDSWYRSITDDLNERLQCYSKHKPFVFGNVMFIEDARQRTRERELEAIRASIHLEKGGELEQIMEQLDEERRLSAEQAQHINDLRSLMHDEYRRGIETEQQHVALLEDQLEQIKADNASLRMKNESMNQSFSELGRMREIIQRVQSIEHMPQCNEDVINYYQLIFADRIAFTERGAKSANKSDINPDVLWDALRIVAMVLVDLYRDSVRNVEKEFKNATGWDLATTEGPETRKKAEYMNLRKDVWEGREISIEPHVKFPKSVRKTGAQYQRLHYAYDTQSRRIIIGYIGEHLENYLSLSFH